MSDVIRDQVRQVVRKQYSQVAESESCCSGPSCCGTSSPAAVSQALGYSADETAAVPEGANMGLGCGNPQAIASLKPGETVLDLGSGGGFDCFLAAQAGRRQRPRHRRRHDAGDGQQGARQRRSRAATRNVEFRLGEIEHLPVADAQRRRDHLQLRHQPLARQAAGVRRGFRVLEARRPAGDLRRRRLRRTARAHPGGHGAAHRLHGGRVADFRTGGRCCSDAGFEDVRIDAEGREQVVHPRVGAGDADHRLRRVGHHRSGEARRLSSGFAGSGRPPLPGARLSLAQTPDKDSRDLRTVCRINP